MHKLFIVSIFAFLLPVSVFARTIEVPNRGTDLNTLDAYANYITSKNVCKKISAMNVNIASKPFLLGAYDLRDGINSRIPEENYNKLLESVHKNTSPLVSKAQSSEENLNDFPNGLQSQEEQISYLTAYAIARSFGKKGIPVLPASMAIGLADALTKDAPKILASEEKNIVKLINNEIKEDDNDWAKNRNHYYLMEERAFLAANITKPNVISLDSGVQYIVVQKGKGKIPKPNDTVTLNYKGALLDGTEFDSSYKRNKPDTFKLSSMIKGFTQAITQVPEGSSIIMFIPAALAYGEEGNEVIPPYAAIAFEVELLSIKQGFFN